MNWISFLSQAFFVVIATNVSGSVMYVVWFLCRKLLQNKNPKVVHYMLKWVAVMFLLPITYLTIVARYDASYIQDANYVYDVDGIPRMLFVVNFKSWPFMVLAVAWVIGMLCVGGYFAIQEINKHRLCKSNFEDGMSLEQEEFERIRAELGISDEVILLRNDDPSLMSPFVTGILKKAVVLPYWEYDKEQLNVMFYHELNHVKKSDVIFRYLTMLVVIINCFNPLVYLIWKDILLWSEADCDARAVDGLEHEGIDKDAYYAIIRKMQIEGPKEQDIFQMPMLRQKKSGLDRRMDIMEKYKANMKNVAKSATFALMMVFSLLSTSVAYAAGIGASEINDSVLKGTQTINMTEDFVNAEDWSDEISVPSNHSVDIVYINDGIMLLGEGTISWNVPVGTRYVTSSVYLTAGTEVQIACTATPTDCLYWFGIMHASSECTVVQGSGIGAHTFTIPSNGYYRIMVENRGSETLNVTGGYQY